jgi:hypothetical protein
MYGKLTESAEDNGYLRAPPGEDVDAFSTMISVKPGKCFTS